MYISIMMIICNNHCLVYLTDNTNEAVPQSARLRVIDLIEKVLVFLITMTELSER